MRSINHLNPRETDETGGTPVYSQRSNGEPSALSSVHQGVSRRGRVKFISRAPIEVSWEDLYTIA